MSLDFLAGASTGFAAGMLLAERIWRCHRADTDRPLPPGRADA